MTILEFQKKGRHMNTLEKYYIYKEAIHDNHLNDQYTVNQNKTVKIVSKNEAWWDASITQTTYSPLPCSYILPPPPNPSAGIYIISHDKKSSATSNS